MAMRFNAAYVEIDRHERMYEDGGAIFIPKDLQAWIEGLKNLLERTEVLRLVVQSTDFPQFAAVGFPAAESLDVDPYERLMEGKDFGFLIDATTARQLSALFAAVAVSLEREPPESS